MSITFCAGKRSASTIPLPRCVVCSRGTKAREEGEPRRHAKAREEDGSAQEGVRRPIRCARLGVCSSRAPLRTPSRAFAAQTVRRVCLQTLVCVLGEEIMIQRPIYLDCYSSSSSFKAMTALKSASHLRLFFTFLLIACKSSLIAFLTIVLSCIL